MSYLPNTNTFQLYLRFSRYAPLAFALLGKVLESDEIQKRSSVLANNLLFTYLGSHDIGEAQTILFDDRASIITEVLDFLST